MSAFGWPEKASISPPVYYYRYDDVRYSSGVDEFDNPLPGYQLKVELTKVRVHHFTPSGVRFDNGVFMLNKATKRYACATEAEAKASFIARKKRQIEIHKGRIEQALKAMKLVGAPVPAHLHMNLFT